MNEVRLKELLEGFTEITIAVIGDFFLDKWLIIDRGIDEMSIETGLTAYQVTRKRLCPGAAGTITNNLAALGIGKIYAVGFAGKDGEGLELKEGLEATEVDTGYLYRCEGVFTPTYIKPLFNFRPKLEETNRLDIRNRERTPADIEDKIIDNLYEVSRKVDAIIALDQVIENDTGVITGRVREALANLGASNPELIIYADSRAHTAQFKNVIIKCNHQEALSAVCPGWKGEADEKKIKECALKMAGFTGRQVFVTWGENGIITAKGSEAVLVPAVKVEGPVDICGAGDAATAGIVCSLCRGASGEEAAFVANLVSSITIQQLGTTGTASRAAIQGRFKEHTGRF